MDVVERNLTDEERIHLVRSMEPHREGCASQFIVAGLLLIVVPTVSGGLLGLLLRTAGVRDALAGGVGLTIGFALGVWMLMRSRAQDARQRSIWRTKQALVESTATARIYRFEAVRAWEVADYDHGPAYLIAARSEGFVYVHAISSAVDAIGVPRQNMEITVAHPLGIVLSASATGDEVQLGPRVLDDVGLSDPDTEMPLEFALLTPTTLPEPWKAVAAT